MTVSPSARRADLDWIRVGAFGLLILYHVALVYAPWDWHVHSRHYLEWLRDGALVTNPWRLTLLFLVSGAALRLMSRRLTPGAVLKARIARLAPPFLFGVLVLVPPQAWIEAMAKGSWHQGLGAWWLNQFSPANLETLPLNHLWFVLYIAVYSLAAIALLAQPAALARLEKALAWATSGWRLLVLPIVYLGLVRQFLFWRWGLTNHLTSDWYNHAISLAAFLAGFALVGQDGFWRSLERQRWVALSLALIALPLLMALEVHPGGMAFDGSVKAGMFALDQWATIAAILGFGSRHLRRADSPILRYLNQAIFPCYLIHQTLLVAAGYLLLRIGLPLWIEAPALVAITLGGSLAVYELVRRVDPIRPIWGLKPLKARGAVSRMPAPASTPAPAERSAEAA
ncbi:acyltransferase family protein [Caulobacter ginsengisoli]|uniref:acyltransferase family protein n=1 Tax=Caulobacter ginsengisoli TaxID=400775 RepID=UPI0027D8A268|nr:acyltransferase family protein [Caulobacter ginsengisoli]